MVVNLSAAKGYINIDVLNANPYASVVIVVSILVQISISTLINTGQGVRLLWRNMMVVCTNTMNAMFFILVYRIFCDCITSINPIGVYINGSRKIINACLKALSAHLAR